MVYRDSLQFLHAFRELLTASLLKTNRENFYNLHEVVAQIYIESDVELLVLDSVLFFNYVDSFSRRNKPALPPRTAFFNKLGCFECSEADYVYAQQVFANFQCESLKEYMQLNLLSNICLLADVVQMFQNNSLNE